MGRIADVRHIAGGSAAFLLFALRPSVCHCPPARVRRVFTAVQSTLRSAAATKSFQGVRGYMECR